ncbi:MAG: NfeD family protein [Spirochaetota bacterium]|nr:NfeD family protein [Spirochaetota bacterium]
MALSPIAWLAIGIVLMAVEIIMPGFIIFWFGIGAVITAALVYIGLLESEISQWFCFFISSGAFLVFWFGYLKDRVKVKTADDALDVTLAGKKGKCIKDIIPPQIGEVELFEPFHGVTVWKAQSKELIRKDEQIVVEGADGIKLIVKKL